MSTLHEYVLGEKTDSFLRKSAINLAIVGFLIHLGGCTLYRFNTIDLSEVQPFVDSYLDALYTPFSIILAYEVYELIRAIPESFSNSIGKQFEVVTLLVVRDIFKNLADVGGTTDSSIDSDLSFIAMEAVVFVALFATALYFRSATTGTKDLSQQDDFIRAFVTQKKHLACALAAVYVLVACYSFSSWSLGVLDGETSLTRTVFFLDFFTWLIVSDIIILLVSYKHITDFPPLARNTGFILSTVIIRVGIGTPGYTGAVLFMLSAALAACVLRLSLHDNPTDESE
ncbi:MAG: hypothetical protein CMA18_001600 [Methanobacteriota archaeon]|nr:MAG: hypothetical protein CBC63_07515 [Euryarchaeota archaeon TMED103]RAH12408.1 MAG: hypothetical protein CMA18_001600 [Euryarchaeota archaeon]|tara:strand:+ start:2792 stop:3646 length:855 start_codon:yes stop_codon:yes gene_type:complete